MALVFSVWLLICIACTFTLNVLATAKKDKRRSYDPGVCSTKARGKLVLVKDRLNNDKLLVCIEKTKKFHWVMINGYSYGNYFDPAKDCSDIVDNVPKAESGVYWIKTNKGPKKVWCDVFTDGGGFMLVGVTNSYVTWDVPSDLSLVIPSDTKHWSAVFGNMDVLDFRIQLSTSKRFVDTKSDWYYRFNSSRKLTKLLMRNQGGCSSHFPGIGNIAYIKDLRENRIVTRNFQCSRFGAHFLKTLGWGKMNACLGTPCSDGYAHLGGFRYDNAGSFSYSVKSSRSGIRHNSTAFIGCDQGKCCACFGPSSDKDYCAPMCKPINGGTVLKKNEMVHIWFWIRSSLPKRVWKKCMEYEKNTGSNNVQIWHIDNEGGLPKKGRCLPLSKTRLTDGVAIVSNYRTFKNLPNIEGLLTYRSDIGKLYLRVKSGWRILGTYNQIQQNQIRITVLNHQLKKIITENKNMISDLKNEFTKLKRKLVEMELENSKSCEEILQIKSSAQNGVYRINVEGHVKAYCQMKSLPGCSGGGWTLVMKIDGKKETFHYTSPYWSNKQIFNLGGGQTGFDEHETKLPTYWKTSFKEMCLGMKVGNKLQFFSLKYPASSLYSLIASGTYRSTNNGKQKWKSLIQGSSIQPYCNREGFNVKGNHATHTRVRIGMIGNEVNSCILTDSFIGFGGHSSSNRDYCYAPRVTNSCGNSAYCGSDN